MCRTAEPTTAWQGCGTLCVYFNICNHIVKLVAWHSIEDTVFFVFRVWNIHNAEMVNSLVHHCEAVLHLRFQDGMMVTCSKDRSIAVWDMHSPTDIILRRVLVGHRAAVNVVDFDDKYIVSASGDRTIKVGYKQTTQFNSSVWVLYVLHFMYKYNVINRLCCEFTPGSN